MLFAIQQTLFMERNKKLLLETLEMIVSEANVFDQDVASLISLERQLHLDLLSATNYIKGWPGSRHPNLIRLTWSGYDLLDDLRKELHKPKARSFELRI